MSASTATSNLRSPEEPSETRARGRALVLGLVSLPPGVLLLNGDANLVRSSVDSLCYIVCTLDDEEKV